MLMHVTQVSLNLVTYHYISLRYVYCHWYVGTYTKTFVDI